MSRHIVGDETDIAVQSRPCSVEQRLFWVCTRTFSKGKKKSIAITPGKLVRLENQGRCTTMEGVT